jgi:homocysteine S-methyltransferase
MPTNKKEQFFKLLKKRPIVIDGAMGTELYNKGVKLDGSFEEQNISKPKNVSEVYEAYANCNVDIIKTNSFGANSVKLAKFMLGDKVDEINKQSVLLAKPYLKSDQYLSGSIGPCLNPSSVWNADKKYINKLKDAFNSQANTLIKNGVDMIMLETFSHISELTLAINCVKKANDNLNKNIIIVAGFTLDKDGYSATRDYVDTFINELNANANVDIVLLNCGVGPSDLYDLILNNIKKIKKPLFVSPNAGTPNKLDGRTVYLNNPEYFARFARRFVMLGVKGVGGCCGTNVEHIKAMVKELKNLEHYNYQNVTNYQTSKQTKDTTKEKENKNIVKTKNKTSLSQKLYNSYKNNLKYKKATSIELVPPRGTCLKKTLQKAQIAKDGGADCINLPDGPRASARLSPFVSAVEIQNKIGIETILHYTCRDRNLLGIQSDLLGAQVLKVLNILAVTGDPPKLGDYPDAKGVFDIDAIGLIQIIKNLNNGFGLGGNELSPTSIHGGVALNPMANFLDNELDRLKQKIACGAEFIITQPVFDSKTLIDCIKKTDANIPIMAGIWPLYSYKNAEFLHNEVPGINISDNVMKRMRNCKTKQDGINMGIEIAKEIAFESKNYVQGYQVSAPFERVDIAIEVLNV